jgi:hypothetical protein
VFTSIILSVATDLSMRDRGKQSKLTRNQSISIRPQVHIGARAKISKYSALHTDDKKSSQYSS